MSQSKYFIKCHYINVKNINSLLRELFEFAVQNPRDDALEGEDKN